jgi:hypothetical protein
VNLKKFLLTSTLTVLTAHGGFAWSAAVDQRIALKALTLAPPDLRLLLQKFRPEFEDALARAEADEGSDRHFFSPAENRGKLRTQLEAEIANAIAVMKKRQPTGTLAERLGVIAHLVADANNPFHTDDRDSRLDAACRDDFNSYVERKTTKMPTVFYGLSTPFRLSSYLDRVFDRSARLYPLLGEEYFRDGERHSGDEFDDRSTAFGVASVSYSHAVTDLVNIYFFIWKESGGDVRTASALRQGNLLLGEPAFRSGDQ